MRSVGQQNVSKARKAMCGGSKSTSLVGEIFKEVKQRGAALGLDSASGLLHSNQNILRLPVRSGCFMPAIVKYIL